MTGAGAPGVALPDCAVVLVSRPPASNRSRRLAGAGSGPDGALSRRVLKAAVRGCEGPGRLSAPKNSAGPKMPSQANQGRSGGIVKRSTDAQTRLWRWLCATWPGEWVSEYRFAPPRRWRFDFASPARMLAIEVEGLTHAGGRHQRPAGYQADLRKYNAAVVAGWRLLRFSYRHLADGSAYATIEAAMGGVEATGPTGPTGPGSRAA